MKQRALRSIPLVLALLGASNAKACVPAGPNATGHPSRTRLIDLTNAALLEQIKCQRTPQVARAINAMLKNRLIRYVQDESGVYLFATTAPLKLLGLRVTHISGFDYKPFDGVPGSIMAGTSPFVFLEIDVAAPAAELRKRALEAGLIEAVPYKGTRRGFEVSADGSYLRREKNTAAISKIECIDY